MAIKMSILYAIVLPGGSGVRLWLLSRETWPKQMLQIVREDTLIRQTIKQTDVFVPPQNISIVTTEDKAQDIKFHLEPLGRVAKEIQFVKEPLARNTAPTIGLTAIYLNHISPESIMIVMPSDHTIKDTKAFQEKLILGIKVAEQGYLVTFGIKPNRPETAYGYVKSGQPWTIF